MNGIGDSILSLPALRALAAAFPGDLTLICAASEYTHIFNELDLRRLVCVQVTDSTPTMKRFDVRTALEHIDNCDIFVSLVPWHSPDVDALMQNLKPALSIGFAPTFDVALPLDFRKHTIHLVFDAVRAAVPDARLEHFLYAPIFDNATSALVIDLLSLLPAQSRLLVVHGDTQINKMWPVERLRKAIARFLDNHADYVCFVVGATELGLSCVRHDARIISSVGLPLPAAQCLVSRADLFLGIDSCHLHMADLTGVPSVALFGPTQVHEFGPVVARHVAIQAARDMTEIEADVVVDAMEHLVDATRASRVLRLMHA